MQSFFLLSHCNAHSRYSTEHSIKSEIYVFRMPIHTPFPASMSLMPSTKVQELNWGHDYDQIRRKLILEICFYQHNIMLKILKGPINISTTAFSDQLKINAHIQKLWTSPERSDFYYY